MSVQYLFDRPETVARWVAAKVPSLASASVPFGATGLYQAIGVVRNGQPVAGMVVHDWRDYGPGRAMCQLTFATAMPKRWATRGVIRTLLSYPFLTLRCGRVTTIIGRSNEASQGLCEALGFRREGVVRRGLDGTEDAMIYGLLREEADRWLKE